MTDSKGKIVAIDCGTKRVGIAVSDPLQLFAQPFGTFDPESALRALVDLNRKEHVSVFVIGWPLLPDGTKGKATDMVDRFVSRMKNRMDDISVIKQDERFSSEMARELLSEGPKPSLGARKKGRLDTAAAGLILQDYLNTIA